MGGAVRIALKDATNQVVISKFFWEKKVGKAKKSLNTSKTKEIVWVCTSQQLPE